MSFFTKEKLYNLSVYGIGQVFNLISPLLITPYIVYKCGEEGLGKIGISLSLMFILIVIVDYGSYIVGVRDVALHREDKAKLQSILTKIYILKFFLMLFICLIMSASLFVVPYFAQEKTLFLLSLVVIAGQFVNPGWFFQGIENFKWITITNIISKLIYIALVFCLVKDKSGYVYVNFVLGIGAVIGNGIGVIWILKNYCKTRITINMQEVKESFRNDFRFCVSQLFLSSRQYMPILVIGFFCGNFIAGQHKIIEQIIMLFRTYLQMFFRFVFSTICVEVDNNVKKGLQIWRHYNLMNFGLILILILVLFFTSEVVLHFFKISSSDQPALSYLLRTALVIPFLFSISNPLEQLMFAFGKNKVYINITILSTFFNLIVLLLLVKKYVLYGAVISISLTEIIVILVYYYTIKINIKQRKYNGISF